VIATNIIRSSSQFVWRRLRNINISNDHGSFTFYVDFVFPLSLPYLAVYMSNMACILREAGTAYSSRAPGFTSSYFSRVRVAHILCFYFVSLDCSFLTLIMRLTKIVFINGFWHYSSFCCCCFWLSISKFFVLVLTNVQYVIVCQFSNKPLIFYRQPCSLIKTKYIFIWHHFYYICQYQIFITFSLTSSSKLILEHDIIRTGNIQNIQYIKLKTEDIMLTFSTWLDVYKTLTFQQFTDRPNNDRRSLGSLYLYIA